MRHSIEGLYSGASSEVWMIVSGPVPVFWLLTVVDEELHVTLSFLSGTTFKIILSQKRQTPWSTDSRGRQTPP